MSFEDLGLSENILKAIEECGYTKPTPIQEQAIPIVLMGRDVVGLAQTGTGKTASFTLPMIDILDGGRAKARMPRSLILSPTRELAAQIAENFDMYGKHMKLNKALLTGGTSMDEQIKLLDRGVDVLIATPGRLLDLFERGRILMSDIKILVIDEADRMLDMGFIPDIEKIVSLLSPIRQTLLFSATMPPEIKKLSQKFQSNPKEVAVSAPASTATTVEQFLVHVHAKDKQRTLEKLIRDENVSNAFIFCNRKRDIDGLVKYLKSKGFKVGSMHGDMVQKARTDTLDAFKAGEISLLVCSDVAARGIDVQGLSHVFNYDVPFNADDYVHRIGRTGRAGMNGRAWMLATNSEEKALAAIERLIKKPIPVAKVGGESSKSEDKPREEKSEKKPARKDDRKDDRRNDRKPAQKADQKPSKPASSKPRRNDDDGGPAVKGFGDELPGFFGKSGS